ncbi:unnamed protein product [Ambrosiozyma monospora]|uniref:ubiquitinyl hydrolase 1 n=1 Tax=Ambrosiozyma monospora TaxID=43982 RepID=A0A9W7DKL0_AMBMO|nr:unnamed protein product [Ambrosiozyma monospora]
MISSDPTDTSNSASNKLFSPIINRILSNPLSFQAARTPDKVSIKPSSYITFKTTSKSSDSKRPNTENSQTAASSSPQSSEKQQQKTMARPKSMYEAVARYTESKYLSKKEKKKLTPKSPNSPKVSKGITPTNTLVEPDESSESHQASTMSTEPTLQTVDSQTSKDSNEGRHRNLQTSRNETSSGNEENNKQEEEDDDDDDEDDVDFQTADEDSNSSDQESDDSNHESSSSEEVTPSPVSDAETENLELLKKEAYEGSADEKNESSPDMKEENDDKQSTPPTSSDEDLTKQKLVSSSFDLQEFYDLDEKPLDQGSNGSTRIFKNWREFKPLSPPLGLLNHGVTCYTNSAVQALCHIPSLLHYLVDIHNGEYALTIKNDSVSKTLADTVARMYKLDNKSDKKPKYINPKKLIRKLGDINCMMSEWQQEDSHEYYMSLMSRLQEDSTPRGVKLNESIIYDIFGGLLNQTVTCQNCGHTSSTQQEFYDLSLGLDNRKKRASSLINTEQLTTLKSKIEASKSTDPNSKDSLSSLLGQKILNAEEAKRSRSTTPESSQPENEKSATPPKTLSPSPQEQPPATNTNDQPHATPVPVQGPKLQPLKAPKQRSAYPIESSIRDFFSLEMLKTDKKDKSGYTCENCKKTTTAVKFSTIERAPETLTIHLKRFRFDGTSSMKVKTNVSYPNILDLTEYTTKMNTPTKYKLMSVIVHQGRSVSSGHYIAHCRQPDGSWATYDDEYVNRLRPRDALSEEGAYVLVYSRLTHKSISISNDTVQEKNGNKRKLESGANRSGSRKKTKKLRNNRNM